MMPDKTKEQIGFDINIINYIPQQPTKNNRNIEKPQKIYEMMAETT